MEHYREHGGGYTPEDERENPNQTSKYDEALRKYNTELNDDEIAAKTAKLIEKHLEENNPGGKEIPFQLHRPDDTEMYRQRTERHEVYRKGK